MGDLPPPRQQSSLLLMHRASQPPFKSPLPARPPWQPPMRSPLLVKSPSCLPHRPSSYLSPRSPSYLPLQSPLPVVMQSPLPVAIAMQPTPLLNNVNGGLVKHMPRIKPNQNPQAPNPPSVTGCGWINLAPEPYDQGPFYFGARPNDSRRYHRFGSPPPQPRVNVYAFVENKREMVQNQTSTFALLSGGTGVFHPLPYFRKAYKKSRKKVSKGMRKNQGGTSPTIKISNQNDGLVKEEEYHQGSPSSDYGLPKEWTY
ncbi:hypothetical protein RIF29_39645 [Crotalaria pallida]|uniref:Uncharacterized protein n=1 Tax=Crotalaria pallida TaxID=3830 RepID=A0AAN9HTI3_CROPI